MSRCAGLYKNELKPWRKKQWVIVPTNSAEFVAAIEDVLEVYARPVDPKRPLICLDECTKQLTRKVLHELKNQWGWNGFTTQRLAPYGVMANLIALVYKWWNLYVRLFDGEHQREAITSRPMLLSGVALLIQHSAQRTVKVSLQHENSDLLAKAILQVSSTLHRFHAIAQ